MVKEYKHLTEDEIAFFMANGYLIVKQAFSREKAAEFTRDMWVRLGIDPNDKETWPRDRERIHMPAHIHEPVATFAPRVWGVMTELLGGEERVDAESSAWGDSFIVNFGSPASAGAPAPDPRTLDNWHVDGDFFVHFLDSPEQALLVIPVFSDIAPGGGATYIAPDGIARAARYLAAHPEGVYGGNLAFWPATSTAPTPAADPAYYAHPAAAAQCEQFVELTAQVGDVVLLHPLMLHTASPNRLRVPRVITNPRVELRAPFEFARGDPDEYSLVERKTLQALGVDRFEFKRTGERKRVVPERVLREAVMIQEEKRRLEEARARAGPEANAARPIAVA
ncbi:hypothetical protein TRAPUB_10669 [Trametes pubescens]|uniref:Phytanoyl-CoA dioxygenase family protein n=1 Tax=Trametes pubescens TaxID=154538 RepID=A0A1M2VYY9_TRAPU|nr:hypothetical protein TRAPUB_10669 [Trametes pubescens]